jgi:hypothetical protein
MKLPTLPNFFNTAMKHDPIKDNLIDYHENLHKKFRWTPKNSFKIIGFIGVILASHEIMIASMVSIFLLMFSRETVKIQTLPLNQHCFSFSKKVKETIKFYDSKIKIFILFSNQNSW